MKFIIFKFVIFIFGFQGDTCFVTPKISAMLLNSSLIIIRLVKSAASG
ncbi:hypothetical protein HMPREF1570_5234 [Klebsiella oxytoca KA-2]|nr:hypothetical protein HMPREF1570_5234 [Klebsiella oxytoca KA-2]